MGLEFARYVSAAPGRLVSRWDAPQSYIGARKASEDEVKATGERIVWIPGHVVAMTKEYCDRFDKELRCALADGDLVEKSKADFEAWLAFEQKRDEELHPPKAEETPTEPLPEPEAEPAPTADKPSRRR